MSLAIVCDKCDTVYDGPSNHVHDRLKLRQRGWVLADQGRRHYCNDCVETIVTEHGR